MKKRGSLRTILTFLFLLIGVVPLLVVGIFSYINLNNNAESQVIYSLGLFTEMANSRLLEMCIRDRLTWRPCRETGSW